MWGASSETELQPELKLARVGRASSLAEKGIVQADDLCPAQLEVGVIENVERFCAELQSEPLGELKALEKGCVEGPVSRAKKGVAAQITYAAQARLGEEADWKIEAVGPLGVRRIHMVPDRVGTVIADPIQVIVATDIDAFTRIERNWFASVRALKKPISSSEG